MVDKEAKCLYGYQRHYYKFGDKCSHCGHKRGEGLMDKEALNITKGTEHPEEFNPEHKEAQEKILELLKEWGMSPLAHPLPKVALQICQVFEELGYRKIKDKLPLLDGDYACRLFINNNFSTLDSVLRVAQAQWDICVEHYEGGKQ